MPKHPVFPSARRKSRRRRQLHAVESRLDRLEGDLKLLLAGGELPEPRTRAELASRWLLISGGVFIVVAIGFAIF